MLFQQLIGILINNIYYKLQYYHLSAFVLWLWLTPVSRPLCVVSTVGFGLVLDMGFVETLKLLLWVVFIDCIGVGLLISTLMW